MDEPIKAGSPYLNKPLRTEEQARHDQDELRCRGADIGACPSSQTGPKGNV